MTKSIKLTPQKIHAAMRKAGIKAAKFQRSGMVRGWGSWSSGYRATVVGDAVQVEYEGQGNVEACLQRYVDVIRMAGLRAELTGTVIRVTLPEA